MVLGSLESTQAYLWPKEDPNCLANFRSFWVWEFNWWFLPLCSGDPVPVCFR